MPSGNLILHQKCIETKNVVIFTSTKKRDRLTIDSYYYHPVELSTGFPLKVIPVSVSSFSCATFSGSGT